MFDSPYNIGGHVLSALTWLATVMGFLPTAAVLVAMMFYLIQIWESQTTQRFIALRRSRRLSARIARLEKTKRQAIEELSQLQTPPTATQNPKSSPTEK